MPRAIDVFVGERIRDRRIELGLTQTELAATVRITAELLNDYEHGIERVDPEALANIVVVLHCPLSWLFGMPGKLGDPANRRPVNTREPA